jgi:signal recognition particle GTPase
MLSQANAEPDAAENPTGPIAGVRKGVSMNDMLKNIPEAPPKVSNIQQSKTAPQEIESALQSVKAPELDNPAQRALDMAERRLRIASDPKEVSDLNSRIEKLKDMVQRLQAHKEMEIF